MSGAGEIFLSASLPQLLQQLKSEEIAAPTNHKRVEVQFASISESLTEVIGVLEDAEEQQLTKRSVKSWLEELRDVAYDLDDILDEIKALVLIRKSHRKRQVISNPFCCCSNCSPQFIYNHNMVSKIDEITGRLKDLSKQRIDLRMSEKVRSSGIKSPSLPVGRIPKTSFFPDNHVFGREKEKEAIFKMLCGNNDDLLVISIVGMGGLGKTTLAESVCYDPEVERQFDVIVLAYLSKEFDKFSITKKICDGVGTILSDADSLVFHALQRKLKEVLQNKKFLIVLDDVWNENYDEWVNLLSPLSGRPGSTIIVTTRSDVVAKMVTSSDIPPLHLSLLNDEDCLSLMAQHACISFDDNPEFTYVGMKLMEMCKGLPLAAKLLGGVLQFKANKEEWEEVLHNKIWDLHTGDILPVLRLSYFDLPPHLKCIVSYCSIFPKDCEFERTQLVLLWMGDGLLEQDRYGPSKEEWGDKCFTDLLARSFFQPSYFKSKSTFVMHDLVNDLARHISQATCYHLGNKVSKAQKLEKLRHCSFLHQRYQIFSKFEDFQQAKGLRTLLSFSSLSWRPFDSYMSSKIVSELLPKLQNLRVLSLSEYCIKKLPSSICELIHLRYLDLSRTHIIELPDSLDRLIFLETLSISGCGSIKRLPEALGNLHSLRHFDNSETNATIPSTVGKLKYLQTLPLVILSKDKSFGLKDLRSLEHFSGTLTIQFLANVTSRDFKGCLKSKRKLHSLHLVWGAQTDPAITRTPEEEEDVLEGLQPPENLRKLELNGFRGSKFPCWIGHDSYKVLSDITLWCSNSTFLPPLGQLPNLVKLCIAMDDVSRIGQEFYGNGTTIPFPKLERLTFANMPKLREWSSLPYSGNQLFSHLQDLEIVACENLENVPPFSFLRRLVLLSCSGVLLQRFRGLGSLTYLEMRSILGLHHLPRELVQSLSSLENLDITGCDELEMVWPKDTTLEHLSHMKTISLVECPKLRFLGHGSGQLPRNLQSLEVRDCPSLVSLPNDLSGLNSCTQLAFIKCEKLESLQENGMPQRLRFLKFDFCDALESLSIINTPHLQELSIINCGLQSLSNFPSALKRLELYNCRELDPIPNTFLLLEILHLCGWDGSEYLFIQRISRFPHLVELKLIHCNTIKHIQELPPTLKSLTIQGCTNLESLLPGHVPSMESLEVKDCSQLVDFPSFIFPSSLSILQVVKSGKLKPLKQWELQTLPKLSEFYIKGGFPELQKLNEDDDDPCLFPASLIRLHIDDFPMLNSLSIVLENLDSLQFLEIWSCKNLSILPSERLLQNLHWLKMGQCPVLRDKYIRAADDYLRSKIGIPLVEYYWDWE